MMHSVNSNTTQPYTHYSNTQSLKKSQLSALQSAVSQTLDTKYQPHPIQQCLGSILQAPIALLECLGLGKCLEALTPQHESTQQANQATPEPLLGDLIDRLNQFLQEEQNPVAAKARFEHEMPKLMAELASALQEQRVEIGDMVQFNQTVNAFVDKYSAAAPDTFWTEPFKKLTVKALNYWSTITSLYIKGQIKWFEEQEPQFTDPQLLSLHEYAPYQQHMQHYQALCSSHETLCTWLPKLDALDQIHRNREPVLSDALRADPEVMLRMIQQFGAKHLLTADPALLQDPAFILEAVHANPKAIEHIPRALRSDPEMAMAAIAYNIARPACAWTDLLCLKPSNETDWH
jgi:hypothetical protein